MRKVSGNISTRLMFYNVLLFKFSATNVKVKSAYEPKQPIRPELIPVSVALSD